MSTKAHDLFVSPLCRKHHDELHADTVAFEEKYGSQLELIFRFIDRVLAIGASLIWWRKLMRDIQMVLERWGWAASDSSGVDYSPIAAGFKGIFPYIKQETLGLFG